MRVTNGQPLISVKVRLFIDIWVDNYPNYYRKFSNSSTAWIKLGAFIQYLTYYQTFFFPAWALKKGFLTAKAARPDAYRAANHLLRMALIGRICLCLRPPGYTADEGKIVVYLKLIKNLCTTELRTFIQYTGLKFKYWFWFYCNTGNQYSVKT